MIKSLLIYIIILSFVFPVATRSVAQEKNLQTPNLVTERVSKHTYRHISYLKTNDFGRVACNGLIIVEGNEAIIVDTPVDDEAAFFLIEWVENALHCKVKAVVATHFHADCLGGLKEFHRRKIPSYANQSTIAYAEKNKSIKPQTGFTGTKKLSLGKKKIILDFLGEGHTKDNIIVYYPKEQVMFGGCLIKEQGASKGNLEDANVQAWPLTVKKLKSKYPETKIVIPGHGKSGDLRLLDYTVALFTVN